jgi:glucan phosphoethanolaminetransferase (alkaline phosphatase superfamily)
MIKDILYAVGCLTFSIMIGGAVYEHLNVVPTWSAAPPASLSMFQGKYGLNPELFWMLIHPVNLFFFALNLIFHWKSLRRRPLLIVALSYILILAITASYFVPELLSITTTAFSESVDAVLTKRASLWETLSLVRLGVLVVLAITLMAGLTKPNKAVVK